ncbi:hypothetical protein RD792_002610 [Penstemon davidsonii]|uniref:RING-type domain-containing protein n=1 Tax=Penstemon davidsonii TaxID=160366 RepID=A0ABR0DSN7_9LAMI|nr:hypothetical protein RD792_002610 [Penstemon davidsonii]
MYNYRELMMMNGVEGNGNVFGSPIGYGVIAPSSGTTTATETLVPIYGSAITETSPTKTAAMKSDSGLTYAVPISRKRSREVINNPLLLSSFPCVVQNNEYATNRSGSSFTFLGEDISYQIQQQQMEIDRFIAQHTEKVRTEIEERRKRYTRRMAATLEDNIMKKLKAKEEEIEKIVKLNWALEERVKSLCVENQLWKDLAQSNEATANDLRSNLEQLLIEQQRHREPALVDDAQSSCGSNFEESDRRTLTDCSSSGARCIGLHVDNKKKSGSSMLNKMCRSCGKEESCVLVLPCRHLCLCTVCGASLHTCPICNSIKTASVHVNLYS